MSDKPKWTSLQERRHDEGRDHNDDSDGSWVGAYLLVVLAALLFGLLAEFVRHR
jgi:hypothetical protein